MKKKYYVVWEGHAPGVYDTWAECRLQTDGYPGAKYKGFDSREEAVEAFRGSPSQHLDLIRAIVKNAPRPQLPPEISPGVRDYTGVPEIRLDAIAVDGACAGNPGRMEYRGVRVIDGAELFRVGAAGDYIGTNNIAEYLAIIHVAALLKKRGDFVTPIYTDSKNTLAWLRRGGSKTTLARTPATAHTLDVLARADAWLAANGPIRNPILKWQTELWGEIPADFGRK